MAGRYGLTYGLAKIGTEMMPAYYAAQARDMQAKKDAMGIEALQQEMERRRRASEEAAAYDEAMLNPETAGETLRSGGYGSAAMKAESAIAGQQATALKQQEDYERTERKRKFRVAAGHLVRGQGQQAAEVLGLDDLRVDGDKAFIKYGDNEIEMPYGVFAASLAGEPEDVEAAINQYGKEVRSQEVKRMEIERKRIADQQRYELGLKRIDAMMRKSGGSGGGGGLTAMQRNQAALKASYMKQGLGEVEADQKAWAQVLGNTRWKDKAADIRVATVLYKTAVEEGDPEKVRFAEETLSNLFSQNEPTATPTKKSTPQLPPGFKPVKR